MPINTGSRNGRPAPKLCLPGCGAQFRVSQQKTPYYRRTSDDTGSSRASYQNRTGDFFFSSVGFPAIPPHSWSWPTARNVGDFPRTAIPGRPLPLLFKVCPKVCPHEAGPRSDTRRGGGRIEANVNETNYGPRRVHRGGAWPAGSAATPRGRARHLPCWPCAVASRCRLPGTQPMQRTVLATVPRRPPSLGGLPSGKCRQAIAVGRSESSVTGFLPTVLKPDSQRPL
jgi:hypothetical protein